MPVYNVKSLLASADFTWHAAVKDRPNTGTVWGLILGGEWNQCESSVTKSLAPSLALAPVTVTATIT